MASVTIRNIDDDVKRRLQVRAARNGRSLEHDLRIALHALAEEETHPRRSEAEALEIRKFLEGLGRRPTERFDQKAITDELWSFVE